MHRLYNPYDEDDEDAPVVVELPEGTYMRMDSMDITDDNAGHPETETDAAGGSAEDTAAAGVGEVGDDLVDGSGNNCDAVAPSERMSWMTE